MNKTKRFYLIFINKLYGTFFAIVIFILFIALFSRHRYYIRNMWVGGCFGRCFDFKMLFMRLFNFLFSFVHIILELKSLCETLGRVLSTQGRPGSTVVPKNPIWFILCLPKCL